MREGRSDEVGGDRTQRGEVVHVVVELGHVRDRGVADALLEPGELAALAVGDLLEVGEVRVPRGEPQSRRRSRRRSRRASSAARARSASGSRAVSSADARGSRSSASTASACRRAARRSTPPSSTASRRGVVTSTNAVSGAREQLITCVGAVAEPFFHALRTRGRTRCMSSIDLACRRPARPCARTPAPPRCATRKPVRVGAISSRKIRLSSRRVSRRGASRKSSAWRVGGVSTTMRSNVPGGVQLVELLHRHVLLRARERAGDVPVEAVLEDALGLLLVLARTA